MTTEERLENLERELARAKRRNRRLMIGAGVCLGLIVAWIFFAQPSQLDTAQAASTIGVRPYTSTPPGGGPQLAPGYSEKLMDAVNLAACEKLKRDEWAAWNATVLRLLTMEDPDQRKATYQEYVKKVTAWSQSLPSPVMNQVYKSYLSEALSQHQMQFVQIDLAARRDKPMPAGTMPKEVCAGSFVLVDENGKLRASLAMNKEGPSLRLYDENGKSIWTAP